MYDLIIIGGGMSGISVGHYFRNQSILLLEKNDLLSGATGNNAGFLITGFGEHFSRTAARWGTRRAAEIQRIHLASHRRIHELTDRFLKCGSLTIGLKEKETSELRKSYDLMRAAGLHVEWREKTNTGLRASAGGLFNPEDGLLDSKQFWKDLAASLPVVFHTPVLKVREDGESLRITTGSDEFRARNVVYCLNAYSGDLLPELKGRILPLRAQMVELEIYDKSPGPEPVIAEYGEIYWNFTANTLRFGGLEYMIPDEEVGIVTSLSTGVLEAQLNWIQHNFGIAYGPVPLRTWYGTMGFTVDGFPVVGKLPGKTNQYVLAGMCGLGHSYALECASWIYELIVHERNVIPAYFSSDRILNLPRYSGGDWRALYEAWNH